MSVSKKEREDTKKEKTIEENNIMSDEQEDNNIQRVQPLLQETVWMDQPRFEEAEAALARLNLQEDNDEDEEDASCSLKSKDIVKEREGTKKEKTKEENNISNEQEDKDIQGVQPLLQETVWMDQPKFEKAEAALARLNLQEDYDEDEEDTSCSLKSKDIVNNSSPLQLETIWFFQHQYEAAEALYHMHQAGTWGSCMAVPTTPSKRLHHQDDKLQVKKHKVEGRATPDILDKALQNEIAVLSKTKKSIEGKLEEFEKAQQRKTQAIRDTASRLTAAIETCQARLNEELAQSAAQLNSFRSLLTEVEAVARTTNENMNEQNWGRFKTHEGYCHGMTEHLAKLGSDLNSCIDLCQLFQTDPLKSEINRIVGDIGKVTLSKAQAGCDRFKAKKEMLLKSVKDLLNDGRTASAAFKHTQSPGDSEASFEGYGSLSSDESETPASGKTAVKAKLKPQKGRENKTKKALQNGRGGLAKANRNNSNAGARSKIGNVAKVQADAGSPRPVVNQVSPHVPKKRNAQGVQNPAQKKQDLFKFRGGSQSPSFFAHQPGILGPRPNAFPMQDGNQQPPFGFSGLSSMRMKQPHVQPTRSGNSTVTPNRHGLTNMNFNFANSPPHDFAGVGILQHSAPAGMNLSVTHQRNSPPENNISNPLRQSKLFQLHKNQMKGARGAEQQVGGRNMQPGFSFHSSSRGQSFSPASQHDFMNRSPQMAMGPRNMERQLNEISQKLQQMQLAASQNFQLQHLMQETERLKQLITQKQHQHQQQDRFQQQFQLLINAFLQQQQQQLAQGPQSKMPRPMQFHSPQKPQQRIMHNRLLQQQKKQKQQQNKVQQVKQKQQPKADTSPKKVKEENVSNQQREDRRDSTSRPCDFPDQKPLHKHSKVMKMSSFDPYTQGDRNKPGISSIVVLEDQGCLVLVDIVNSCLKLYEICHCSASQPQHLEHQFVTRLELPRPYYMSLLTRDTLVVSRDGKKLSLIKVSKKRLEFLQDVKSESQYFGLAYVRDNIITCAAFADKKVDLVSIQDGAASVTTLVNLNVNPELVAAMPATNSVLYLERLPGESVQLFSISQQGRQEFRLCLDTDPDDICNLATIRDKIICGIKQSNKLKLITKDGDVLIDLNFPVGSVNQPFAMAFSKNGKFYLANDGAWDNDLGRLITSEISIYIFT